MCLAQGPQRSDAGEAQTRGPTVSSQALYHWATALPIWLFRFWVLYSNKTYIARDPKYLWFHEHSKNLFIS